MASVGCSREVVLLLPEHGLLCGTDLIVTYLGYLDLDQTGSELDPVVL